MSQEESNHKMELAIGNMLRTGVILAASMVALGALIYLYRNGGGHPDYRSFRGEPSDLRSVSAVVEASKSLSGRAVIQMGLILLIATPIARVLFSVFVFLKQKDRMYTFFTLIVLALLIYSLLGK